MAKRSTKVPAAAKDAKVRLAEAEVGLHRSTAYKFMRIAKSFGERFANAMGADRLVTALGYIDATSPEEREEDIPSLTIPVPRGPGKVEHKPIVSATVREITCRRPHWVRFSSRSRHTPPGGKVRVSANGTPSQALGFWRHSSGVR
jgi:hypothetical protein